MKIAVIGDCGAGKGNLAAALVSRLSNSGYYLVDNTEPTIIPEGLREFDVSNGLSEFNEYTFRNPVSDLSKEHKDLTRSKLLLRFGWHNPRKLKNINYTKN